MHWHGLRLDNAFDGVPHETQEPITFGGYFTDRVRSRTPASTGTTPTSARTTARRWAFTATSSSIPSTPTTGRPCTASRVTLDDILVEDGQSPRSTARGPTHAAMGRFGNVMLVAGDPELALTADAGEVVRLFLTNTANTRVFNVALPGARMKLVGGDSGRCEHETFVDEVVIAPSERADRRRPLRRGRAGHDASTARPTAPTRWRTSRAATRHAVTGRAFEALRTDPELTADANGSTRIATRPPDKTLAFVAEMPTWASPTSTEPSSTAARCTPTSSATDPGRCPTCGMKLIPRPPRRGSRARCTRR